MNETLAGERWAVITGAGRGIGRDIAGRLAAQGWSLELADVLHDGLAATVAGLPAGTPVNTARVDLRDRVATDAWIADVLARRSRIDALIHDAGVGGPDGQTLDDAMAHFDHVLEVNTTAVMRLSRGMIQKLPTDGSGRIVVIASILGRMGVAGFSAYCTSKSAVIGLARAMALDLAPSRITVNCVCPGWTDTDMARQGFEAIAAATHQTVAEARAGVERGLPLGRIVQPTEIADLVAFLVSPACGAMTGQALLVCAGDLQK